MGVAYSEDNGNTFIKPFDSPIIPNTGNMYQPGMRDPKVFWFEDASYENGGIWAMVVAGGRAQLFTSSDLIHWQRDRELCYQDGSPLDSECPDLFPLAADGDGNNIKWIYNGGGVFYLIGELFRAEDGKLDYRAESAPVQPVNGISELFDGSGLFPEMYAAQTFSLAFKYLQNKELAEDAVQNLFLKLWLKKEEIDETKPINRYLFTMLKNDLLNTLRDSKKNIYLLEDCLSMVLELEDDSQNENLKQEQMNIIQQALEQLSPQRRKVFEMKVSGKYSNQEIADKLNLSINTIKFQYSQSLKQIRSTVGELSLLLVYCII